MICDSCKKQVSQTNWWLADEERIELCNKCFFKDTGLTTKKQKGKSIPKKLSTSKRRKKRL